MAEVELLAAPRFKRGHRFDWLYDQMVATGRLGSLLSKDLDLPDEVWQRLRSETDHELRAALICLMTAALAEKGTAAIIGEAEGGWFWLPPWSLWEPWATTLNAFGVLKNHRQAVRKIILTQRVEDIQSTAYGDGLPKVPSV
jgi:hypothetical protein